jgi:Predicted nucleic acid-binding protein, contains PIN domain
VIHLDTSFLIRALVPGSPEDKALRAWIRKAAQVATSALAWSEFLCGPVSPDGIELAAQLLGEPLAFGATEATAAAMLFNQSGRRRGSLVDCMIAAVAIEAGADLATANVRDFQRFEPLGLRLVQLEQR